MPGFFLDLRDHDLVMDFVTEYVGYLPETERKKVDEKIAKIEQGEERPSIDELADLARRIGRKSWSARHALTEYFKTQSGCDEEWRKVVAAVSTGTAHLLERFRHGTKCESLDATLNHEESASAFRDMERLEIEQVRRTIRETIWHAKRKDLVARVKDAEEVLKEVVIRLDTLRGLASDAPWIQDQLFPKLQRWEDDLYFAGKTLNPSELDEEIKYYREEKELPAEG